MGVAIPEKVHGRLEGNAFWHLVTLERGRRARSRRPVWVDARTART